jgi:upstream activation factor subunit UAF30
LIEARFDAISGSAQTDNVPPSSNPDPHPANPSPKRQANGHAESIEQDDDVDGEIEVSLPAQPAKKKQKREEPEDADAKLAAELQAQENSLARGRTTRGSGGTNRVVKKKKAPRKKSEKRVRADDDSDVDGSEDSVPTKRKAAGGFQKPFNLSYPLAELCGEPQVCVNCAQQSGVFLPRMCIC